MKEREYLGNFETMVLLSLLRLGEGAYGVPITDEIERQSRRRVAVGSVYAALERLERKGLVTSHWGEPTAARGGRAKKHFTVTASGLKELRHTQKTLINLWRGVPELKG
jgi:DNA-binding PadR family transcriptional regulator